MLLADFKKAEINKFIDHINFKELKNYLNQTYDMHIKKIQPNVVFHQSGEIYINLEITSNAVKYIGVCNQVFDGVKFISYCSGLSVDSGKLTYVGNVGIEFSRDVIYSIGQENVFRLNFLSFEWDGKDWRVSKYNEL